MTLPLEPHTDAELAAMKRWAGTADAEESLRERVARAIYGEAECRVAWGRLIHEDQEHYRRTADAAIEAMTTPVEPEPFAPGTRVEVHEVPGGYVVALPGVLDEDTARLLADAARPAIDADTTERDGER